MEEVVLDKPLQLFCRTRDKRYFIYSLDGSDKFDCEEYEKKDYSKRRKEAIANDPNFHEIEVEDYPELLAIIAQSKVMNTIKIFREATANMSLEEYMKMEAELREENTQK